MPEGEGEVSGAAATAGLGVAMVMEIAVTEPLVVDAMEAPLAYAMEGSARAWRQATVASSCVPLTAVTRVDTDTLLGPGAIECEAV